MVPYQPPGKFTRSQSTVREITGGVSTGTRVNSNARSKEECQTEKEETVIFTPRGTTEGVTENEEETVHRPIQSLCLRKSTSENEESGSNG